MGTMERIEKILEISPETLAALERLSKITGAESGVGELIQDALRVYEWTVSQQAVGRRIIAVPEKNLEFMTLPETARMLEPLFDEGATEEAKQFFGAT
jgi:hypothetical protein